MEPLVMIPEGEWGRLRDRFRERWPQGLPAYYALHTQLAHEPMRRDCHFRVYCPYGDFSNGVVATLVKNELHEVIIVPASKDTRKLEDALATTNLIQWNEPVNIPWASLQTIDVLKNLCSRIDLKVLYEGPTITHLLFSDTKPFDNMVVPPNTYVAPVRLEHVHRVNDVWPHRNPGSEWFFTLLIKNELSYGLFSTDDKSLLAWMFINEVGFLTHLYCEESHRKHGYAEFIVKYVSNEQLSQGKDVFCYITEHNVKSLSLFAKLGFKPDGKGVWTALKKINS